MHRLSTLNYGFIRCTGMQQESAIVLFAIGKVAMALS